MQKHSRGNSLIFLFALAYFASYVTRTNFGAVISAILQDTGLPKPILSVAVTGNFIAYGVGQLLSGMCGDYFSPKKLVASGLLVSSLMNMLIPLCGGPYQMAVVWCVNGLAQAFIWPPLVKLMSATLSEEDYRVGMVRVSWGSSMGTMAVYLVSPLLISLFNWRAVFFASAFCGCSVVLLWHRNACDAAPCVQRKTGGNAAGVLLKSHMLLILLAIILMGMLRDGVTTWMPSYLSEIYQLDSSVSILAGVILPIFSILSVQVVSKVYERLQNTLLCALIFFAVGASAAAAIVLLSGKLAAASVFFSALLTGCMHGVNLMLITILPTHFRKYGNVSTVSGVLNSCTYIGSAVSTYGIAVMAENSGWSGTLRLWIVVAALGAAICGAAQYLWKREGETVTE